MLALLWTFPVIMVASFVIGWAAELTAIHLSAGIALAVLAWLQTAPEFAVEASIAWGLDSHLALANLTGSLRLLMGLGWPMVFFIYWISARRRGKRTGGFLLLPPSFAVEAGGLAFPVIYFLIIWLSGKWTALDGVILCAFYFFYFWLLNRARKFGEQEPGTEELEEEEAWIVKRIQTMKPVAQYGWMLAMFVFGGLVLYFTVHPFIESLKHAAFALGVSEFVFIQWVAPVASEFPEKVTAFNWARKPNKAAMGIVNLLSSITSQWTLLAGMIPILFSLSAGHFYTIEFTPFQKTELLLTIAQAVLAVAFLSDLKINFYEMAGLFVLWLLQCVLPNLREELVWVYLAWFAIEAIRLVRNPSKCEAWIRLRQLLRSVR